MRKREAKTVRIRVDLTAGEAAALRRLCRGLPRGHLVEVCQDVAVAYDADGALAKILDALAAKGVQCARGPS